MARKIYTDAHISDALAVFAVTGSYKEAAASVGCSITTVKKWEREHGVADSGDEKSVEELVVEKVADLRIRQEEARSKLMDRIIALVPEEASLRDATWSYGVLTDKSLLSRGQPTSIVENVSPGDARKALEQKRDELAERRQRRERVAA
jgi:hypothetical protein